MDKALRDGDEEWMEETDKGEGNVIGVRLRSKKKKARQHRKRMRPVKRKVNLNYKRILSFLTAI